MSDKPSQPGTRFRFGLDTWAVLLALALALAVRCDVLHNIPW